MHYINTLTVAIAILAVTTITALSKEKELTQHHFGIIHMKTYSGHQCVSIQKRQELAKTNNFKLIHVFNNGIKVWKQERIKKAPTQNVLLSSIINNKSCIIGAALAGLDTAI